MVTNGSLQMNNKNNIKRSIIELEQKECIVESSSRQQENEPSSRGQEDGRPTFQQMQDDLIRQYSDWFDTMTDDQRRELTNTTIVNCIKFLTTEQQNSVVSELLRQQVKPTYEELVKCLGELVDLKTYKDEYGKTDFYTKQQPVLWGRARKLLERINK